MIIIKKDEDIAALRQSARIAAEALEEVSHLVRPGASTQELDAAIEAAIKNRGATPSFLGYRGYRFSSCISVNEQVVHGLPSDRRLAEGDIVGVDVGAYFNGFHGDVAVTLPVGRIDKAKQRLLDATKEALYQGLAQVRSGHRLGAIGAAVEGSASRHGYSVVRELFGHGIGQALHEDPLVPNYGDPTQGPVLRPGMTLAIEPMLNAGGWRIRTLDDGWTVVTLDGKLSAHFEHTVLVQEEGAPEILTRNALF